MTAPKEILRLIERYDAQRDAFQSGRYKETELRVECIDPFFKALGWDVHNEQGYAEACKDVIHEEALKTGTATEAPDSCFRIGGTRKFFVACKKPSVNIKDAPHPAYQLRRYGWSAKLPLSILTDFEEFAVYDCRLKPGKGDGAAVGRVLYLTSGQYAEQWDEIASIFSREAVLKGSFDKFAEGTKGKRGTTSVDDAFLEEIERWRDLLARSIALRNPGLSQRELNFSVQRIIDRIIFLRICEDRGIEPYGRLMTLRNGERVYSRLCEFFQRADERYNSGLFHFQRERDRPEAPDELTLALNLDDKVLRDILSNLYYPESPYEFSVLSADILGQVYERFLGKVIRLTAGHQAKVEDKPEVRKAGGVFYTPDFITKAIVRQTIGPLLEGKSPIQVAKLRFCDMACGSGSFLIEAFQFLLDWHRDCYLQGGRADPPVKATSKRAAPLYQTSGGAWRLTTEEKKRILLNNIFGVDIDSQAVEVTKLSLLLKVLEGESQESITKQFELFHRRALPDLGSNIICGNSLIGPEAYRHQQLSLLPEDDRYRINVFDWQTAFPAVFKADTASRLMGRRGSAASPLSGFDAIIGNPPYIRIQMMKEWAPAEVELNKSLYRSAVAGNYDIYVVFLEKALSLLNKSGRLGFILPNKLLNAQYGRALRGLIAEGQCLSRIVHFGDHQVFPGATTYTCLLFLDKAGVKECHFVRVVDMEAWRLSILEPEVPGGSGSASDSVREAAAVYRVKRRRSAPCTAEGVVSIRAFTSEEWNFAVGRGAKLVERLQAMPVKLGGVADIFVGLQTSADDVFILDGVEETVGTVRVRSKSLGRDVVMEKDLLHPLVSGRDVSGYRSLGSRQFILFPYEVGEEQATLIPFTRLEKQWPKIAAYLIENRERLAEREKGKFQGSQWYRFGRNQNLGIQGRIKICVPRLVDALCAAYDQDGSHFLDNVDVGGVTLKPEYTAQGLRYLLALLNSRLLRWFFPNVSATFRGGWFSANRQFLSKVPIRLIDFSSPADELTHAQLVGLVDQIVIRHRQWSTSKSPHDKEALERQIHAVNVEIDRLVYELYGLSDEEIGFVEGRE